MMARAEAGDAGGSLVVIASTAGIEGAARNAAYGASKGAVMSMVRAIAVELAATGFAPILLPRAGSATDMTMSSQKSEKFTEKVISRVPSRRWGSRKILAASPSISRAMPRPITQARRSSSTAVTRILIVRLQSFEPKKGPPFPAIPHALLQFRVVKQTGKPLSCVLDDPPLRLSSRGCHACLWTGFRYVELGARHCARRRARAGAR